VVTDVIAIGVCEILSALEIAGTVTTILVTLGGIRNNGSVEGTVVNPASLNRCREGGAILLSLHTDAILGNVLKGYISYLKALTEAS
jgi:hypothetical protein